VVIEELFTDINNVLVVIKDHHATPHGSMGWSWSKGSTVSYGKMVWCGVMTCFALDCGHAA